MKLKLILPWLCVAGLLIGLICLYSANEKQAATVAKLTQDNQELEQARAAEDAKKTYSYLILRTVIARRAFRRRLRRLRFGALPKSRVLRESNLGRL